MKQETAKKIILSVFGSGILLFIGLQFIPVDRSNPPITQEICWNAEETKYLAQRACYDCHANTTRWPWYAYIAPISWRVADHVHHGREHLNFSEWDRLNEDVAEIIEVIYTGEMPLQDYLFMHPKLTWIQPRKRLWLMT